MSDSAIIKGITASRPARRFRARTAGVALAMSLFASGAAAITVATPALATGPVMNTGWSLDVSPGGTAEYYLTSGTPVEMVCWTRGPSADGTQKWFYVGDERSPFPFGYVPANAVSNQISTPLCG